jgi:hypothetical protein
MMNEEQGGARSLGGDFCDGVLKNLPFNLACVLAQTCSYRDLLRYIELAGNREGGNKVEDGTANERAILLMMLR